MSSDFIKLTNHEHIQWQNCSENRPAISHDEIVMLIEQWGLYISMF